MIRTVLPLLCCATGALAGTATAQPAHAPAPGLWETRSTLRLNGRDVTAQIDQARLAAARGLPADVRAAQGIQPDGAERQCLTPAGAQRLADPRAVLARLENSQPGCRFEPIGATTGATLRVRAQCKAGAEGGFTGTMQGEFQRLGPREAKGTFSGKGRVSLSVPGVPASNEAYEMRSTFHSRWLQADCGAVEADDDED